MNAKEGRRAPALLLLAVVGAAAIICGGGAAAPFAMQAREALLAFSSDRNGHPDLFVLASAGGVPRALTSGQASDRSPVFAPNGQTLLFVSDRIAGNNDIWRVRIDGSGLKQLTESRDDDGAPDWSPDAAHIVYSEYHVASYDLYSMRADGSAKTRLANDLSNDVQPRWSPDGQSIAFVRSCQMPEPCMKNAANRSDGPGRALHPRPGHRPTATVEEEQRRRDRSALVSEGQVDRVRLRGRRKLRSLCNPAGRLRPQAPDPERRSGHGSGVVADRPATRLHQRAPWQRGGLRRRRERRS